MNLQKHVNDSELQTLLYDDEDTMQSAEIAQHVEACELCQQRLMYMSSMESSELEVSTLLNGFVTLNDKHSQTGFEQPISHGLGQHDVLLGPPSHPEMLGRLGRYEIERMIGSGGMGIVFKAIDTELNRPVAVKVLAPHLARNGAAKQRFGRESRAAAAVVHEHVVAIHNVESERDNPFIVMQYVSGESLQARVARLGPLDVQQILRIGIQAASGLAAAHEQGIVHRDVKPANILLEEGVERVLLTDFGLARTVDDASLTHTGVVAGTPHYMSPEQANGDPVDYRSDLFSLGAVLYFIATGHPPFRAERAMGVLNRICHEPHRAVWQVNAEVPNELSCVIDRLLEKRPSRRYPSAIAVRDTLTRILQQLQSRKPSMSTKVKTWARRNLAATLGLATISVVIAGFFLVLQLGIWFPGLSISRTNNRPFAGTENARTENANPALQTYPQSPEVKQPNPQFAEIDHDERTAFVQEVRELHQLLDKFGVNHASPVSSSEQKGDWSRELRELNHHLDRIENSFNR
jgi:eukaryotic-like serine/threonine-protein kinase